MAEPSDQGGVPHAHPQKNVPHAGRINPEETANPSKGTQSQGHTSELGAKENIDTQNTPVMTGGCENHHAAVPPHDPAKGDMSIQHLLKELELKEEELKTEKETNEKKEKEMKNFMTDWFSERHKWYMETAYLEQIRSAEFIKFQVCVQEQSSEMQREHERAKLSMKMEMEKISERLESERKEWSKERQRIKAEIEMERERMQMEFKKHLEDMETAHKLRCDQMLEKTIKKGEEKEECEDLKTWVKQMNQCSRKLLHNNPELNALRTEKNKMNEKVNRLERLVKKLRKPAFKN